MATKVGVRREKKEKTPGREFGVGVRGADASRIDAGAGIGSFNPFNQPFNNQNVYDAAVPMIPRSKSNPQLGNYAVPGLDVPSEPAIDPQELLLAQAAAQDMRGNTGTAGIYQIPSTIQNDLAVPQADGGVVNNWAQQAARSYGLRTDDKYRQAVDANRRIGALIQSGAITAAEARDPNSPYYTPPMQVASSGTGMDAKTFRQRIGAKAKENQAARAADPIRQKVQANALARQAGGVGIVGDLDGNKLMQQGLATGNKELFQAGAALAARADAARQQEFSNKIEQGKLENDTATANAQVEQYKREAEAESPAKPGTPAFARAAEEVAKELPKGGKELYDAIQGKISTFNTSDPNALELAGGMGITPEKLADFLKYDPRGIFNMRPGTIAETFKSYGANPAYSPISSKVIPWLLEEDQNTYDARRAAKAKGYELWKLMTGKTSL